MVNITFDMETLRNIQLFEQITKTKTIDCLDSKNKIIFLVPPGHLGRAIGKGGANAKRLRDILKKNVEIVEFSHDLKIFVRNLFIRFRVREVVIKRERDLLVIYVSVKPGNKARAIGMDGSNLRLCTELVKRHFNNVREIYIQ